jgi:hypothetical protein
MSAEEKLKQWRDDSAQHGLIWASVWGPESRGVKRSCELCGIPISVWPVVAETAAKNPLFHLLCREKCLQLAVAICGPIPFAGRIRENELPPQLKRFREVGEA